MAKCETPAREEQQAPIELRTKRLRLVRGERLTLELGDARLRA